MMCEAMEREMRAEQLGDVKIGGAVARQIGARRERSERDETGLVYLCRPDSACYARLESWRAVESAREPRCGSQRRYFFVISAAVITAFVGMAPGAAPPSHENHWPNCLGNEASVLRGFRYLKKMTSIKEHLERARQHVASAHA